MGEEVKGIDELLKAQTNILARPNAMSGKYKSGNFGLEFWDKDYLPEQPDRMIKRADLADKLIAEAKSQGRDVEDDVVLQELGREVNKLMGEGAIHEKINFIRVWFRKIKKFVTDPEE